MVIIGLFQSGLESREACRYDRSMLAPWQQSLANTVTDFQQLCALLALNPVELFPADQAIDFPLRVPRELIARMKKGDASDPLLLQVLPQAQELNVVPGYSTNPLNEKVFNPVPGLLHKYHGRVLLTLAASCAVNCRYCFRRHFPYEDNVPGMQGWEKALDYIRADNTISEVIFSGGEPLVVKDTQLKQLVDKLDAIPHVKRLRIHTRLPVMIPSRVTESLLTLLRESRLSVAIVLHANHANEIDDAVKAALEKMHANHLSLLNQSVLLKNVNNNVEALSALSEVLFTSHVVPYYLHVLDPVQGAAHFNVPREQALLLMDEMRNRLPGYLVPRLVCETPGARSKTLID